MTATGLYLSESERCAFCALSKAVGSGTCHTCAELWLSSIERPRTPKKFLGAACIPSQLCRMCRRNETGSVERLRRCDDCHSMATVRVCSSCYDAPIAVCRDCVAKCELPFHDRCQFCETQPIDRDVKQSCVCLWTTSAACTRCNAAGAKLRCSSRSCRGESSIVKCDKCLHRVKSGHAYSSGLFRDAAWEEISLCACCDGYQVNMLCNKCSKEFVPPDVTEHKPCRCDHERSSVRSWI
jgi:hypothetical protein